MPRFDASEAQLLKEYEALRAEILLLYSRRSQRLTISWAGISAIIVAAAITKLPELALISTILASSGWIDDVHNYKGMIRLGSFIKYHIEDNMPGIRWQSMKHDIVFYHSTPSIFKRFLRAFTSNYGLTSLISVLAAIFLFVCFYPSTSFRITACLVIMMISAVLLIYAYVLAIRSGSYRSEYNRKIVDYLHEKNP
jgi:hypothetical protein